VLCFLSLSRSLSLFSDYFGCDGFLTCNRQSAFDLTSLFAPHRHHRQRKRTADHPCQIMRALSIMNSSSSLGFGLGTSGPMQIAAASMSPLTSTPTTPTSGHASPDLLHVPLLRKGHEKATLTRIWSYCSQSFSTFIWYFCFFFDLFGRCLPHQQPLPQLIALNRLRLFDFEIQLYTPSVYRLDCFIFLLRLLLLLLSFARGLTLHSLSKVSLFCR
jgi:hypothetical protein